MIRNHAAASHRGDELLIVGHYLFLYSFKDRLPLGCKLFNSPEVLSRHLQQSSGLGDALDCRVVVVIGCAVFLPNELVFADYLQVNHLELHGRIFDKELVCRFH